MPELDRERRSGVSAGDEERGGTDAKEVAPLHERGPHTAIEPSLSLDARSLFEEVNAIHFEVAAIGFSAAGPIDFHAIDARGRA